MSLQTILKKICIQLDLWRWLFAKIRNLLTLCDISYKVYHTYSSMTPQNKVKETTINMLKVQFADGIFPSLLNQPKI